MEDIVLSIYRYLGYDFNAVELAVRNGVSPMPLISATLHLMPM